LAAVQELSDAIFEQEVLQADVPVIVDFWAPWCGPCHAVEPILRQLEEAYGSRVKFAKLDIDANLHTASRYDVLSIPTAILFDGGEPRETVIGARPRSYYEQAWAEWLTPAQV
jgi:thioredoxin 1